MKNRRNGSTASGPNDAPDAPSTPSATRTGRAPRRLLATTAIAATLAVGGIAVAHGGGWGGGRDGDRGARMVERVSDRLELDDAQGEALGALVTVLGATGETLRGDGVRTELERLVSGPTFDQGAALTMIEARADALRAAAPELVTAVAGFYDGLDESQRAEMREQLDRVSGHRFGHRGGRD